MNETALRIVKLAVSRNKTLSGLEFTPDVRGLQGLSIACANAYFSAPNQDKAFTANEAKTIVDYAIVLLESTSETEKVAVKTAMIRDLSGSIEANIEYFRRKLESEKNSGDLAKIDSEKNMPTSLKGIV